MRFRNGLDGEALGRRNTGIEDISCRGAQYKIGVVPRFASRLTQGDAILEGDRCGRLAILRPSVQVVNGIPLSVGDTCLKAQFEYPGSTLIKHMAHGMIHATRQARPLQL